jgi:hypothetical protein
LSEEKFSPYAAPNAEIGEVLPAKSLPIWLATLRVVAFLLNAVVFLFVGLVLLDQLGVDYQKTPASYLAISFGIVLLLLGNLVVMLVPRTKRIWSGLLVAANLFVCAYSLYDFFWGKRDFAQLIGFVLFLLAALVILHLQLRARRDSTGE